MRRENRLRRRARPLNLNLILWFTFLLFAIVLIVVFTLVQNWQMDRQYRTQTKNSLKEAGKLLRGAFAEESLRESDVSRMLLSVANEYGVRAYLFTGNGEYIYPDVPVDDRETYIAIYEAVKEKFDSLQSENDLSLADLEISDDRIIGLARKVELWNTEHYLFLASSLEPFHRLMDNMRWMSLITALFAVALSFVVSGFVSMVITKPVSEVTEHAKQLARGEYTPPGEPLDYFVTEVNDLSKALDYAAVEIDKTDRMQKDLIANVSHDFKTPLTMIKAYAAMIQEISGEDAEKRKKHTQIIIDETDRLAALVDDVLDLTKLQAGSDSMERTVFNLSEDVYRVAGRFGYLTETRGYILETEIEDDLYTYAGKGRVEQVLYNLIGNAFNYTGEDKRVVVRLRKGEGCSRFEVIDSGKGIAPEEKDAIWERYYRASESHKRPVRGTGLGLSIVKNVLLRYNIPFGVESEIGRGSCFWVDFPDPPEEKEKH